MTFIATCLLLPCLTKGIAVDMSCDGSYNPLSVHSAQPLLSWKVSDSRPGAAQSGYRILVSRTPKLLSKNVGDLWDSGEVLSDQSLFVPYAGVPLSSREIVFWKVQLRDQTGVWGEWSEPVSWRMGLLSPDDWSGAEWIGRGGPDTREQQFSERQTKRKKETSPKMRSSFPSPLLRREFNIRKPVSKAFAYICGLGYSELYLNGEKIGDHVLDPGQTCYDRRALYVTYDITDRIQNGANAVGIMLGNGFFGQNIAFTDTLLYGPPRAKMLLVIEFADGTETRIVTGPEWKSSCGPIQFDNVYLGETYDARREISGWDRSGFNDAAWQTARELPAPTDRLQPQAVAPIRKIRSVKPAAVIAGESGTWILDMGQNLGGWLQMRLNEKAGQEIRLHFAEHLLPSGNALDDRSTGVTVLSAPQIDQYICKGGGETWEPRFTYHGFRYVEISGLSSIPNLEDFTGWLVRSDVGSLGTFSSSDSRINRYYDVSKWTLEDNMQGVLTDCPHRERCAWMGDMIAEGEFASYSFNLLHFWRHTMSNIETVLGSAGPKNDSVIPLDSRAPANISVGKRLCQQARPDWGAATVLVPWMEYLFYGDLSAVRTNWPIMKGWIGVLEEYGVKDGIISEGYGDWCPPGFKQDTPAALTSTALFYRSLTDMAQMGGALGYEADASVYARRAEQIKRAFNAAFYNQETGTYGSQTGDSVALSFGLVPQGQEQRVVDNLASLIMDQASGHARTGIFGHRPLYTVLNDGHQDSVTRHLWNITSWPSLGYITETQKRTTWPEISAEWDNTQRAPGCSANHPMHSGFASVFFESLGGIRPDPQNPGFKKTVLKPCFLTGVDWVNTDYDSLYGKISSHWKRDGSAIVWAVEIPANTTAEVHLPAKEGQVVQIMENKDMVQQTEQTDGEHVFSIPAGMYIFKINGL